jgi:hypothetical protein
MASSFVYEDLVSHAEKLRDSANEMKKILDHRCQNDKSLSNQLISCSFTFIDPYGNHLKDKHFDHQLIIDIIKQVLRRSLTKTFEKIHVVHVRMHINKRHYSNVPLFVYENKPMIFFCSYSSKSSLNFNFHPSNYA